jgi:hypothetical protein
MNEHYVTRSHAMFSIGSKNIKALDVTPCAEEQTVTPKSPIGQPWLCCVPLRAVDLEVSRLALSLVNSLKIGRHA